ncbi:hypothetical protein B0H14DRAFT_2578845 [Mycena olivaceomarginata]|nr:hypothetical protein B0H14DRAFT_2578845 [Mycena olivaceomarginata]
MILGGAQDKSEWGIIAELLRRGRCWYHDPEGFALPPSLPECVQGLLRVDGIEAKGQGRKQSLSTWENRYCVSEYQTATAGAEPTAMDIMGDQRHQKGGIVRQKRRRLVHPLEHLI